jgi:Skp family chaperone for outer membrane proteins
VRYAAYLWGVVIICVVLVVVLLLKVMSLDSHVRSLGESNGGGLAALQDSLKRVQAELATAKEAMPGLGDYMTTIQLHAGKLWFAAKASNWELAEYELDELKETMEAAKGLNAEKNGVKISGVLDSVLQTQVTQLAESINRKNPAEFQKSYDETLSACNGCHAEAGYKFIHIVRPILPPVTNQSWESAHTK